jgi:hypothetical protein
MALIVTPSDRTNCVRVVPENAQAFAGLRVPEPDIDCAGKEPSLVLMPGETLDVRFRSIDYRQAAPRPNLPEPDRPVAASR